MKKLTIIIPVYNEENTVDQIVNKVLELKLILNIEKEIIIVDDFSTDQSKKIIERIDHPNVKKIFHKKNRGKGQAIKSALKLATGDYTIIQDADLEYNPEEINEMIYPITNLGADVVYGSRFVTGKYRRILYFRHYLINTILTLMTNFITNLNMSDMESCYKLIKTNYLKEINLKETRFGFEPEVTIKLARLMKKREIKFFEIGISYNGRTYEEGKKINWKDGIRAIYCLIKYAFFYK